MLPFREGNHTCPQRHKYSEMVGTHHPVGARSIVAGRFWAVRGGETTPQYGCEHATAYDRIHRLRSALMQGGRASLWRLVPPTDMKAEEVDEATPKMLTRISKWQKG